MTLFVVMAKKLGCGQKTLITLVSKNVIAAGALVSCGPTSFTQHLFLQPLLLDLNVRKGQA